MAREFSLLPDAEFEVMDCIWNNECPISPKALLEVINNKREDEGLKSWNSSTLQALTARLVKKDFLIFHKPAPKEVFYSPAVCQQEYIDYATNSFVDKHYNSHFNLMANLIQKKSISPQEKESLEKLLEEYRDGEDC